MATRKTTRLERLRGEHRDPEVARYVLVVSERIVPMNAHTNSSMDLERMNRPTLPASIGRYVLYQPIARGGMATVHVARFVAAEGITRLVAAKRLHPHFVDDPEFVEMFHDEARIASRIHHPNVVPVLDVIHDGEEVILVQEYVHGVPLSYLCKQAIGAGAPIPHAIAIAVVSGILAGLHAAHEARDDRGEALGIVHRDVSPQNVIVSVDGIPRLVDFGIAKAKTSMHHTREGFLKGKLAYMAPEQLRGDRVTRRADLYATGVLLWELVVNRRFYDGRNDADFVRQVALGYTALPSEVLATERAAISRRRWAEIRMIEPIVRRALATAPEDRYATAAEMAAALLAAGTGATATELAAWVRRRGAEHLEKRQRILASTDEGSRTGTGSRAFALDEDRSKSSGARMKLAEEASIGNDLHPSSERPSILPEPTVATRAALEQVMATHTLIPWSVVAALLVIVGLLMGMVIVRDPTPAPASVPAAK